MAEDREFSRIRELCLKDKQSFKKILRTYGGRMKIEIEKEQANRIQLSISDISPGFANALRRYATMCVPVLAIDQITFYDNTSSLFDEYIAHRLGLMPIITPDKLPENVEVDFNLEAVGPKVVYTKELEGSDKEISVAKENIPIVTLSENQKLKLEAKAKLGIGVQHAKFQSGIVSYEITGNKFVFKVESLYHMEPAEVLIRACNALEKDITDLAKEFKKSAKKKD